MPTITRITTKDLREHFAHPAIVSGGVYQTPQEPESISDFVKS